jgi:hypothetical protein
MLFLQAALLGIGAYHLFKTTNKTIFFIYELTKGDHIKFKRGIYSHHAVVVDVYVDTNSYKVIHFTGEKRSDTPAEIKEEIMKFKIGEIIRIRYRYGRLSKRITVKRAYALLRIQETSTRAILYNILVNNCEHFATWCVTGKATSTQVNKALAPFAPIINGVGNIQRPY